MCHLELMLIGARRRCVKWCVKFFHKLRKTSTSYYCQLTVRRVFLSFYFIFNSVAPEHAENTHAAIGGLWNPFIHCIKWTRTTEKLIALYIVATDKNVCPECFWFCFRLKCSSSSSPLQDYNSLVSKEIFLSRCHNHPRQILVRFRSFYLWRISVKSSHKHTPVLHISKLANKRRESEYGMRTIIYFDDKHQWKSAYSFTQAEQDQTMKWIRFFGATHKIGNH